MLENMLTIKILICEQAVGSFILKMASLKPKAVMLLRALNVHRHEPGNATKRMEKLTSWQAAP
ncbi:hypothetical protein FEDK69T_02410 [Flavobacterium enshiense DK69]|nr:hypothetical protein FEDK69T_02410 [Flavobacterium enshiense DK69]